MRFDRHLTALAATALACVADPAAAQTVEELQRQIDELKAMVRELRAARETRVTAEPMPGPTPPPPVASQAPPGASAVASTETRVAGTSTATASPLVASNVSEPDKGWFERLSLRGYTQLRMNQIVSGDATAPDGRSRLRSVHDGGIGDRTNFAFRRIRLILEGKLAENVELYFQPDFASAVDNQSVGESREAYTQIRDAYVDWFPDSAHRFRLRFGQSKVPYGWENMQSSSDRLPLDRADALNSAVPSERDLGVTAYFTPGHVQRIWDRLDEDGQKLFGNYGAFGIGAYNGQTVNREEKNDNLMTVVAGTWPFEIGARQVVEVGGAWLRNRFRPEIRDGGVSDVDFDEDRFGLHAILYPQPFGIQAEWNWGHGPEYDQSAQAIRRRPLSGGYVQTMWRVKHSPFGPLMPYTRWQRYRGGWKGATNAPRMETNEMEAGVEFQFAPPLELTLAYGRMKRREADERRVGRAGGDLIRAQLQWNY